MITAAVVTGHLPGALERIRDGAAYGRGLVVDGPVGTDPAAVLTQVRELVRQHFGTVINAAPAPGRLGLICDAFGGTDLAPDVRSALLGQADPLWTPQLHGSLARWAGALLAAGRGPALVLVNDIDQCDDDSALVLGMLTRRPVAGLVTLVAGRSGRIVGQLLASAAPEDRLRLGPWTPEQVRASRPAMSRVRAAALWESAHGLPGFAAVLAGLPLPTLRAVDRLGIGELADLVDDDVVRTWCGCPDEETRLVLATAAASGMRVDIARLAEACGLPAVVVQRVIGAAQADGLLQDRDGALRFGHPLLRGACYRLVGPASRADLHRGLVRAAPSADGSGDVLEHLAAIGHPEPESVDRILDGAARLICHDPRAATRIAAALRGAGGLAAAEHARAGVVYARALEAMGAIRTARSLARELMADPIVRVDATLLAARCERALGAPAAAHALVTGFSPAGSELTGSGGPAAPVELLVELAAIAAIDPARAPVSGRTGGPAAPALMVLAAIRAERWPDVVGVRASAADAVQAASGLLDGLDQTAYARLVEHVPGLVQALIRLGFIDAASYHLTRALGLARQRIDVTAQLHVLVALVDLHRGRLASALDNSDEALELARCAQLPRLEAAAQAVGALASACRSEPELPAQLGEFVLDDVTDPWLRLTAQTLVEYCLVAEDYPRARELLLRLGWVGALSGDAGVLEALRALTELQLGHTGEARDAVASAETLAHAIGERARVAEAGAAVALATEQFDLAQADARVAVRLHGRAGAVVAEARSRVLLAEALRAAGDLAGAEREAGLAKSTLAGIGAAHLARGVVSVQKRIAASASRGLCAGEFGLSPREAEIAQLVCGGLTNREIGSKLYLSVRTVDTHVARVLTKVGVGSRVALAHMFADVPMPVAV